MSARARITSSSAGTEDVFILASASPRRQTIFRSFGVRFRVVPSDIDERSVAAGSSGEMTLALARAKASEVVRRLGIASPPPWVVGADTVVVVDGEILGKPDGRDDAERMMRMLLGREHEVLTGVSLRCGTDEAFGFTARSGVRFRDADAAEAEAYLDGGDWRDKAGAYAIQGEGGRFVTAVRGDVWNVVGFPAADFLERARAAGIEGIDPAGALARLAAEEPGWPTKGSTQG